MSTFLKETDLAGLKVCSVNSSPSIVSVQSERGASCNSKLSHQSTPGPALKISTKTTGGSQLRACSRGSYQQYGLVMTVVRADIGHETRTTVGQIFKMQQQLTTPTVRMEASDGILIPEITTYTMSINVPLYVSHLAEMHGNVDRPHLQAPNHSASQAALCCRHEYIPKQKSIAHPFPSIYTAPRSPENPVSKQWHINPLRMHAL